MSDLRYLTSPMANHTLPMPWSRDRWHQVTPKDQVVTAKWLKLNIINNNEIFSIRPIIKIIKMTGQ